MKREVTAIVLCILAQAAAADCAAAPAANMAHAAPAAVEAAHGAPNAANAANAQAPKNAERPGGGLIKTAAAGTRDDAPPATRETMSARGTQSDEDHPHRGSTAMLLAALALMSGIALRRFGARDA